MVEISRYLITTIITQCVYNTGPAVSDEGWYIPWYKPSRHKQVSDTLNVWNCHKQVLNNKTIWNRVSNNLQYIIYVNKMLKKIIFFSRFHQITSLYYHQCMYFWLIIYHYSSYFKQVSDCLKPNLIQHTLQWRQMGVKVSGSSSKAYSC